jgi:hypothetical protein
MGDEDMTVEIDVPAKMMTMMKATGVRSINLLATGEKT